MGSHKRWKSSTEKTMVSTRVTSTRDDRRAEGAKAFGHAQPYSRRTQPDPDGNATAKPDNGTFGGANRRTFGQPDDTAA
jgi:hypothetical protein